MHTRYYQLLVSASICCFIFTTTPAQYVKDYKKNADNFYKKGDYYSAALYYEKFLNDHAQPTDFAPYQALKEKAKDEKPPKVKGVDYNEINWRIAESYRQITDHEHAEKYYAKVVAAGNSKTYPLAKYYYGLALAASGKMDAARQQFSAFLSEYNAKDDYAAMAKKQLDDAQFADAQLKRKDIASVAVTKMNETINPKGLNYAAAGFGNTFVFTSARPDNPNAGAKANFINRLFQTNGTGNPGVQVMEIPASKDIDQGIASFNAAGSAVFFTRWVKNNGKKEAAIYFSKQKAGKWSEPEKLSAIINVPGFSSQQPHLTDDGKYLLFASNQQGGAGGFDLYYAPLDANLQPTKVVNFGSTINTKQDDQTPFYHSASHSLVFASNGRLGMGGYDLYQSKGSIGGSFETPVNLGYPVNSYKDDIYFFNSGNAKLLKDAYLSSDRSSACCLELFAINKTYKKVVTGKIVDCATKAPIDSAIISVVDVSSGKTIVLSQLTDSKGSYFYETDEAEQSHTLVARKDDYNSATTKIFLAGNEPADTVYKEFVCMQQVPPPPPPPAPVVDTPKAEMPLYTRFAFNKYDIHPDSTEVIDSLVALLKRESKLGVDVGGYTDDIGSVEYNLKLADLRAKASKAYFVKKGISAIRIKTKTYGKCCPLVPEKTTDGKDNPDARAMNRRVEYRIFYMQ